MRLMLNMRIILLLFVLIFGVSCDDHDPLDNGIHVGYVVCRDHSVMPLSDYESSGRSDASGVVFAEQTGEHPTLAVSLNEMDCWTGPWPMLDQDYVQEAPTSLDSISFFQAERNYVSMGTSCDATAYDGFANTVALYVSGVCPPALAVYNSHVNANQADYIPSVAEMRLLASRRDQLNEVLSRIEAAGCSVTYLRSEGGWYWTSTEVEDDPVHLMWVCSMENGGIMPAMKENRYFVRPVFQLNY